MALTRPKYSQIYDTDYKQSVRVATTGDVGNLLATGNMTDSVDGITLILNSRILVKDQGDAKQNGIYRVTVAGTGANGTWIRDKDSDASDKVSSGLTTTISEGSTHIGKTFKLVTLDPIELGTSLLIFVDPFSSGAAIGTNTQIAFNDSGVNAGNPGLTFNKTGNVLTVGGNVNVTGSILPTANVSYDLGSPTHRWHSLYLSNNTINMGETISVNVDTGTWSFSSNGSTISLGKNSDFNPPTATISGNITAGNVITTNVTGTLQTAAQPNVTSVGTLSTLATGAITTTGTLALNAAGGLTTNQSTFLLANATATTLNIGGAATTVSLGAATGTLNLNNATTAIAGVSTHAGILYANATTASTTYTDGALVVAGGVGIAGNVHIQSGKILHIGPDLVGSYSNVLVQFSSNVNSYSQVLLQNISDGISASSDYICVADTGSDSINYIDHGINSSNYSDVSYTIGTGLDGYSYTNGGNYAIGTQTSGKGLVFHTGGTLSANLRAKITDAGFTVNTTTAASSISTGALVVNGGAGIAGHLYIGGNLYVTNVISSSSQTITVDDPLLYLTAGTTYPYNYDIGFYSAFTGGPANVYAHTGLIRNDADSQWHLFSNVGEPAGSQLSLTNAIYDPLNTGALTIKGDPLVSIVNGGTSGVGNIGAAAGIFNTVYASKLQGVMQTASHPLITTLGGVTSLGNLTSLSASGLIQTTGNVTAAYFTGNGSALTGLIAGPIYTADTAPPASPRINDVWYDTSTDITFSYVNDGDSSQWVDVSSAALNNGIITGTSGVISGTVTAGAFTGPGTGLTGTAASLTAGAATNLYGAGGNYISSSTSGTGYNAAIQVREVGLAGAQASAIAAAPRLGFHWSGVVASSIVMEASGRIAIVNNPGTAYEAFACGVMTGTATNARYADLAENYLADAEYAPGTVVIFGGDTEITVSTISHDPRIAGVISTNPAHLMNSELDGVAVALTGRVPCQVKGPVNKGDRLVSSSTHGTAQRLNMSEYTPGCIIGKSLETIETNEIKLIEVAIGRF
jgi:hypothetical protein